MTLSKPRLAIGLAATVLMTVVGIAVAADVASIVDARQAHFKEIGKAAKAIQDEMKQSSPDLALIHRQAQVIDSLAPRLPAWFPAGSGPESSRTTKAKSDVWTNSDGFRRVANDFAIQARAFDLASAQTSMPAIAAAGGRMGQDCKTCHQQFRVKD
jgi:cytochrome c556